MLRGIFRKLIYKCNISIINMIGVSMLKKQPLIKGTFGRLFEVPIARVLDVLILHRGYDLSLKELAENAGISAKTLWKIMPKLEEINLIKHTRKVGNAKMITLNKELNPIVDHLVGIALGIPLESFKDKK